MRAAAAVALLVLLLALPAAAAPPKRATLKLAGLAPLVVQGRGFGKGERVVLTASATEHAADGQPWSRPQRLLHGPASISASGAAHRSRSAQ